MKISSASKKVLASALSAAMVVAFAPTVAFGAQAGNPITIKYELGNGTDKGTGQDVLNLVDSSQKAGNIVVAGANYTQEEIDEAKIAQIVAAYEASATSDVKTAVTTILGYGIYADAEAVATAFIASPNLTGFSALKTATDTGFYTGDAAKTTADTHDNTTVTDAVQLKAIDSNIVLESGSSKYALAGWLVGYDKNDDGDFDDADDGDVALNGGNLYAGTDAVSVAHTGIPSGATIKAIAQYNVADFDDDFVTGIDNDGDATHKYATVAFDAAKVSGPSISGYTVTVTAPSGTTASAKSTDNDKNIVMAAEAGTYTAVLTDGNGVEINKTTYLVGKVEVKGGVFKDPINSGLKTTQLDIFYEADADNGSSYMDITAQKFGSNWIYNYLKNVVKEGTDEVANAFYDENGKLVATYDAETSTLTRKTVSTEEGGITTVVTAKYEADDAAILSFTAKDYKLSVTTDAASWFTGDLAKAAAADNGKYYMVITDASGAVAFQTYDTSDAKTYVSSSSLTGIAAKAGTYTATLYKISASDAAGLGDATAATTKAVSTKTVEVKGVEAPTWSYAAAEAPKDNNAGTLTLANAAGSDYAIYYKVGADFNATFTKTEGTKYDESKPGITISAANLTTKIFVRAVYTGTDDKAVKASSTVVLSGWNQAGEAINKFKAFYGVSATQTVNGAATTYYNSNADVKAAIAAAEKTFKDAGFAIANAQGTEWNAAIIAADQAYVDAVAAVAKAEVEKLYAGVADKDGNLTKISDDNYKKATTAIAKASADFAANHDGDKTNNVTGYSDSDPAKSYAKAIDNALVAAQKAAVKYAKADVDAAAAVTAQLKDPKTAAAGLEAYAALSSAAKELVPADVVAAQEAVAAAKLVKAQDKAAAATGKAQVKGATYKIKAKGSKTIKIAKSASGAKVTLKQVSGTKYAKVSGTKVTLKKAAKKGKKYTIKVKAVCGATTTSTVSFKVLVK